MAAPSGSGGDAHEDGDMHSQKSSGPEPKDREVEERARLEEQQH